MDALDDWQPVSDSADTLRPDVAAHSPDDDWVAADDWQDAGAGMPSPSTEVPSPAQDLLAEARSRGDLTAEGRLTPALLDAEGPGPFTRGFVTALRKGAPEMLGEAMEGGSRLMDADNPLRETVAAAGQGLKDVAASAPASYAARFNRFADIQSPGDAGSYLAEQAGSGVGSMVPGLVAGGLGAAAGGRVAGRGGAIVGGIAGGGGQRGAAELRRALPGAERRGRGPGPSGDHRRSGRRAADRP